MENTLLTDCIISFQPTSTNKQVNVLVKQGLFNVTISQQFTYNFSSTVVISSITPNVLSVLGKKRRNMNY